ncbi:MAG: hypothetical protein IPJ32_09300 [Sphingobacteriaceae bacterium]|nr:hypothetical protein [Sphingobacteriaceae bacterium]
MKKYIATLGIIAFTAVALIVGFSCRKKTEPTPEPEPTPTGNVDNYTSLTDFYIKNGVQLQTFTLSATTGGTFVSNKSTTINIPANAFVDISNNPVTGTVAINFKDIYHKSDMLLSNVGTATSTGLLKSAGEFFIKATSGSNPVNIAGGQKLTIEQPVQPLAVADGSMAAFGANDTAGVVGPWYTDGSYTLLANTTKYIFDMYSFNTPVANGSWCNSDNPYYFTMYPQTTLTAAQTGTFSGLVDVFLVFKNVTSMVHVYKSGANYPYNFAPVGLPCSVVAVGVNGGKLYSSISTITISTTQTVNFSMTETTSTDFKKCYNCVELIP